MDIAGIIGTVTGTATAVDTIIKVVKSAKEVVQKPQPSGDINVTAINNILQEALDQMLFVKQAQLDILDQLLTLKNRELQLEQDRAKLDLFSAEREKYALQEVSLHSYAYCLKPEFSTAAEPIYLCDRCFDNTKKSLFQFKERQFNFDVLECRTCTATIRIPNGVKAEVHTRAVAKKGWDFFDE